MKTKGMIVAVLLISFIIAGCNETNQKSDAEYRKISAEEYVSKMKAGWVGQMAGVGWGAPTEFKYMERIIPEDKVPQWEPKMVNQYYQDDIYVEMTFVRTLELYGFDVSYQQAGIDFANSGYQLWHANLFGRNNLRSGIAPPDSGHPKFTAHADDIDYQIEADYAGLIAPGMPNIAIELGEKFGKMMNYGDGLYGGQFVGGMYAEAFFETDIEKIIHAGLECIPEGSQYHEMVVDVMKWYKQNPTNWIKCWELIEAKYHDNSGYRRGTCGKTEEFNIDAKINGAYIVMGLMYGQRDIDKTIIISMRGGQDSDCNPSNAAGILFTSMGMENVPDKFKSALDPKGKFSHTPYTFPMLIDVCEKLAKQAVTRSGGKIEKTSGKETFVIPVKKAIPGKLQVSAHPGPIANSRFTKAEMAKIKFKAPMTIDEGIEKFAPGWKVANWGDTLEPGLHKKKKGKNNVLVTHPGLDKTDCVLSRTLTVPATTNPKLALTVSHHPNGDWELIVKANGKELMRKVICPNSVNADGWADVNVDLSKYSGKSVKLELVNHPNDWNHESAFWAKIAIEN